MKLVYYVPHFGHCHLVLLLQDYEEHGCIVADGITLIKMVKYIPVRGMLCRS